MPLESKQHADLVRHRELNALRRLMVQRGKTDALPGDALASQQTSGFASSNAIGKIDALEAQMNQQLFELKSGTAGNTDSEAGNFQLTRIQAYDSTLDSAVKTTQSMPTVSQGPSTIQLAGEHFASGKTQVAQNLLEQAIGERGQQESRIPTWLALFDLYRASDQMDRFEALAMDFSIRFGRSPPPWVSLPQQAAQAEREHDNAGAQASTGTDWFAPSKLSQDDLFALETAVQAAIKAPHQLTLNMQAFVGTDDGQWRLLKSALQYLASMPVNCSVVGVAELEQLFVVESAEATLAKLAWLRCQNRAQQFEDLAIDYSMQFEISPPDWVRPECRFEIASGINQPVVLAPELVGMPAELYGVLDAGKAVKQLALLTASDGLVIRCDRLVRCDPVAVMAISRFAQAAKEQGHNIELQGVHRILAAFFAMQNLYDFAKVTIRRD